MAHRARPSELRHPIVALRRRRIMPAWVRRVDDLAAKRVNARTVHPGLDRGLTRLSRSANKGLLWFFIAGVMALIGRRRAALRGATSLIGASMAANLVGKRLFGGDRPLLNDVPVGRRLRKHPTSPSFPSGHTASAAAFATGVALESPLAGAAIAPLAAAVGYSRLHTGAHWFSDVAGGAVLGIAVAGLGRLLVPARPSTSRQPPTGYTIPLPISTDGSGVLILVNRNSGRPGTDGSQELRRRLPLARIHFVSPGDDLERLVARSRPRILGVVGGDGTVATAAALARAHDIPLLVLPGGTFNHFAHGAGIGAFEDAIGAMARGEGRRVDVAELTPVGARSITVLNTAAVGIYPEFVDERRRWERRLGKPLAALIASLRILPAAQPLTVLVNGNRQRVWSIFIGVNRYLPQTAAPLGRRSLDDGVLDVRVLRADRGAARRGAVRGLTGDAGRVVDSFTTDLIEVEADAPLAHDGETLRGGRGGWTIEIVSGGLSVYSPA
jgi:undecaprenyl-diphosphatase